MKEYQYEKKDQVYKMKGGKNKKSLLITLLSVIFIMIGIVLIINSFETSKEGVSYNEKGSTDYKVYLKENNYYDAKYLDKNMQYISSLINIINTDFKYELHSTKNLKFNYRYEIVGTLKITDRVNTNKILYSKDEVLKSEVNREINANNFIISDSVDIDYDKYNNYVNSYKRDYGLNSNAYLEVKMIIKVNGNNNSLKNDINLDNILKVTIPLSEQTIEINSNSIDNSNSVLANDKIKINNNMMFTIGFMFTLVSLIELLINLYKYIFKAKVDSYQKQLDKLLKNYDTYIINATNDFKEDENIVKVETFNELLDAQKIEQSPIIFYEVEPGNKAYFVLKGAKETYRFTLTKAYQNKKISEDLNATR